MGALAKVDEPGSFSHTIKISPHDAGSRVESTVQYAPWAPLQTLLNALGGLPGGRSLANEIPEKKQTRTGKVL